MSRVLLVCSLSVTIASLVPIQTSPGVEQEPPRPIIGPPGAAQQIPVPPLGDGPFIFEAAEKQKIRVVVVAKGLSHPWGVAFLPDGSMLVTERAGQVRVIRRSTLDPRPVSGVPKVMARGLSGLMDIALHPRFSENQFVYLTYTKPLEKGVTTALARGRWDGHELRDTHDVFVADA
jgi:aldose sugar dehydrogenase